MIYRLPPPVCVQPIVDKCIVLTYQYLEEQANQCNWLNVRLKDFTVPPTFDTSGHAFFGKDCPIHDLFKQFKLLGDNFRFLVGVPRMFMKGPVNTLNRLVTIIKERYLSKPIALGGAFEVTKEFERVTKESGFVSRSSPHTTLLRGLTNRRAEHQRCR